MCPKNESKIFWKSMRNTVSRVARGAIVSWLTPEWFK